MHRATQLTRHADLNVVLRELIATVQRVVVSDLVMNARDRSPVSFVVFRRQLPSAEHSRGRGGSGEPIKALGKLQDCFPRAGIGQLSSHFPRLLGAVEPFQSFIQNRRHFAPPSIVVPGLLLSALLFWACECLLPVVPTDGC